jgi:hypothetical protein
MSVWTRLFGRSESSQSNNKPRLGLESLEAREVPAITFVGGWGTSMYQHVDPANPNLVYLGGSARSDANVGRVTAVAVDPTASFRDFPMDVRGVDAESREVKRDGILNIRDSRALGNISRDQFVFGVEMPTAASDFFLTIPPIKGESSDEKNKPQPTGDTYSAIVFVGGWGSSASPSDPGTLGVEVHCVRQVAHDSTAPNSYGLDLTVQGVTKSGEVLLRDGDMYFVLVTD